MLTIKDAKKAKKDAKKDAKNAKKVAKKTKKGKAQQSPSRHPTPFNLQESPTRYPLTDSPWFEGGDDKQGDEEFGPVWCFCEGSYACSVCEHTEGDYVCSFCSGA